MPYSTQNKSFQRCFSQPISWLLLRKQNQCNTKSRHKNYTKPKLTHNNTKAKNPKRNLTTHSSVRTVHFRVCITVHNCRTQHSTEQF